MPRVSRICIPAGAWFLAGAWILVTDMIFIIYYKYKLIRVPIFQYFITLFFYIGYSFSDCIEKYLIDYNYIDPFLKIMIEGIFQLLIWHY